ncbi:MAG: tyrosine-type recombinase/integrase, partial [Candidatus Obscuribacterales bacterium]|nr:tyrosine-type recombinase/integrase [Candidatus Obscuribacterales bacterium]
MTNQQQRILTEAEVDALVDAVRKGSRCGQRDAALILLMYHYGIKPKELSELRWSWIDLDNGTMNLKRVKSDLITHHHLNREDIVRLKRLKEESARTHGTTVDFVFATQRGKQITTRGIHLIVAKAGKLAAWKFAVNSNMLRRSCAFEVATTGNEKQVQALLGHKRVRNSLLYMRKLTETAFLSDQIPTVRGVAGETIHRDQEVESCLTLQIPASTANLGPGLDAIGLAVTAYTRLTFAVLRSDDQSIPPISFSGGILTESQTADQGDLIYTILKKLWKKNKSLLRRLRLTIRSDIPLGCGLGSSGTAILGALWAAQVLNEEIPTRSSLLAQAQDIEGHPETLAASLVGQLVVTASESRRVLMEQIPWPIDWHLLFVI